MPEGRFRLPTSYPVDYAVAIHIYTLEDPRVYAVVNDAMFNPSRRKPGASSQISAELRACLPFIKFLDAALLTRVLAGSRMLCCLCCVLLLRGGLWRRGGLVDEMLR